MCEGVTTTIQRETKLMFGVKHGSLVYHVESSGWLVLEKSSPLSALGFLALCVSPGGAFGLLLLEP